MSQAITVRKLTTPKAPMGVRCPGRGAGNVPRRLTLMPGEGGSVVATCGEAHRAADGDRRTRRAQCFFPVEGLNAAVLRSLGAAKPGRVRITLPDGGKVEAHVEAKKNGAEKQTAGQAAAAALGSNGKGGKAASGPVKPNRSGGGGALTAALGTVTAALNATASVAGSAASVAGSAAHVAGEGIGLARDGVREAGAYGSRRHERKMHAAEGKGDDGAE